MIGFVLFKKSGCIDQIFEKSNVHVIKGMPVTCKRAMLREELKQAQIEEAKQQRENNKEERRRKKREKKKRRKLRKKQEREKMLKEGREMIKTAKLGVLDEKEEIQAEENMKKKNNIFESVFMEDSQVKLKKESKPFVPPMINTTTPNPVTFKPPVGGKRLGINRLLNNVTPGGQKFSNADTNSNTAGNNKPNPEINKGEKYMGYPVGIYANSITPENKKKVDIGDIEKKPNVMNSGVSYADPLSGFGLHREIDGKTHSDIIKHRKMLGSLLASETPVNRSDIPKRNTRIYYDYEDNGSNEGYRIEDYKGLKGILEDEHCYSVDEDVLDDEIDEIEQNFA